MSMEKALQHLWFLIIGLLLPPCETLETVTSPEKALVELLIICDWNFAEDFKNDETLASFWYYQVLDLNNRLKTLQKTNLQVEVVDVVLQKNQEFPRKASRHDKYFSWSAWLYENQHTFPKFDMAVILMGEKRNSTSIGIWAISGQMCLVSHSSKLHQSMILINSYRGDPNLSELLAETVVQTIVPQGSMKKVGSCANTKRFLMGDTHQQKRFFYSQCADDAIYAQLSENKSQCILDSDLNATDILAPYSIVDPPTLVGQCQSKSKKYKKVRAEKASTSCVTTKCYLVLREVSIMDANPLNAQLGAISPVDNTECDTNSFCFKGLCLPRGQQIKNINSQRCVSSENWFSSDDLASVSICKSTGTPMHTLKIEDGKSGKRMMKAYGVAYTTEILYKCLTVSKDTLQVGFSDCNDENGSDTWQLVRAKPKGNVFVLFNAYSHACLLTNEIPQVKASPLCDATNPNFLFEFAEGTSLTNKDIESLLQNGIGLQKSKEFCFSSWLKGIVGK